jgi:6-phospho-beta-galactosidase
VNATFSFEKDWPRTDTDWSIYPEGMHDLLMFIQTHWIQGSGLPIWITENGIALKEENIITGVLD